MKANLTKYIEDFGFTRIVAVAFFLIVAILVPVLGLNTMTLYSQALVRMAMNGVLVLTMVILLFSRPSKKAGNNKRKKVKKGRGRRRAG